jgi:PRTRC genetic system ThiF family protein
MEHHLPSSYLDRAISVHVVGCGGTGSQVLAGLARLHVTMLALGHPAGLDVNVWDDDTVEAHNVGRQLFFQPDVGMNKAEVMVYRLNTAFGLAWKAIPERFTGEYVSDAQIIIGCVDTKSSRIAINATVRESHHCYWLDMGNRSGDGQAILGLGGYGASRSKVRLPLPTELLPELIEGAEDMETPTCSVRASIAKQGLFLNQQVATWGLELLFRLLTKGRLSWHGVFINTENASVTRLKVDPATWARFGYAPQVAEAA